MNYTKTILVIGNGFDLACNLPTKYTDFLAYYKSNETSINSDFYNSSVGIKCNLWIDYYNKLLLLKSIGEKWVDFEREMSIVISLIDKYTTNLDNTLEFTKGKIKDNKHSLGIDYKKYNVIMGDVLNDAMKNESMLFVRDKLYKDLEILTTVFEKYLKEEVENKKIVHNSIFDNISPSYIVSFNYTHTVNKVFNGLYENDLCYLHGECRENMSTTNMVLGIDEYWDKYSKDNNTDFAVFKKFAQRIMKKTDSITEILSRCNDESHNHYIKENLNIVFYGHSMDISDKDVLKKLFDISNERCVKYTIYCYDKASQGQYIANIIRIIGQDQLIEKVENGTLCFEIVKDGE